MDNEARANLEEFAEFVRQRKVVALRPSLGGAKAGVPLEHFKGTLYFFPFGAQPRVGILITLNGIVQTEGRDYTLAVVAREVVAVVMGWKLRENDNLLATYRVE